MTKPISILAAFSRKGSIIPASQFVDAILRWPRLDLLKPVLDCALIMVGAMWAWVVSYSQVTHPDSLLAFAAAVLFARTLIYFALKLHRTSWLHVSRYEVLWLVLSAIVGPPAIAIIFWILPEPFTLRHLAFPTIILSTEASFYLLLLFGARITSRALATSKRPHNLRRVLIVGAGEAAKALAFQIQETVNNYQAVGFLDDDLNKQNRSYRGIRVLGGTQDLCDVVASFEVQEVVIAITALDPKRLREILGYCDSCEVPVRILPPLSELIGNQPNLKEVREVRMEDLLPRPEVEFDTKAVTTYLHGRTVLVTGGGGSIGSELCRQAMTAGAQKLLVLGRGENSVFEILQELNERKEKGEYENSCDLVPIICDVRDRKALERIFDQHQPEVVFHAAAHKHVPLMEQYPCEAVKNNVTGTLNVFELSVSSQVKQLVVVSTDKAVTPTSVMGATKRVTEMIIQAGQRRKDFNVVCVRFGNVLGSRGSVVPTMTRQIRRGLPVTVTDPDMVRFFMTIPEAVQLILQAGSVGGRGEVFILDMGRPVKILDLAVDLIRLHGMVPYQDIPIQIIGKRPGEKMYEELLTNKELSSAEKKGPFYVAPAQSVNREKFLGQVSMLVGNAQNGDVDAVIRILHEIVPEFLNGKELSEQALKLPEQLRTKVVAVSGTPVL